MKSATRKLVNKVISVFTLFCMTAQGTLAIPYLDLADVPLFIGANVPPQVMLTISKEQQLFKKAYNDYSDLDEDGQLETTYKHDIDYYGYFDSYKCYAYDPGRKLFEPRVDNSLTRNTTTNDQGKPTPAAIEANKALKYCNPGDRLWSGNFLNWVSMSRLDTVRKLLYGGLRSSDPADRNDVTVLERAHLTTDAHSWAKHYPGRVIIDPMTGGIASIDNDISKLTPFDLPVTSTSIEREAAPAIGERWTVFRKYQKQTIYSHLTSEEADKVMDELVPPTPAAGSSTEYIPTNFYSPAPPAPYTIPSPPSNSVIVTDVAFSAPIADDPSYPIRLGDQVTFEVVGDSAKFFKGVVLAVPSLYALTVQVHGLAVSAGAAGTAAQNLRITNVSRTGISFCNTTIPTSGNVLSHTNQDPPLIRVAGGNFDLWNANERFQCYWSSEKNNLLGPGRGSNGNLGTLSGSNASAENPDRKPYASGGNSLGDHTDAPGDFVVRVAACVPGRLGTERCKQYTDGNYKPIGLLQEYGDVNLIQFGLMTGSYARNISGGVLRKNVGAFTDEVNPNTGVFVQTAIPPGAPRTVDSDVNLGAGIINTLNYIRIWGYNYSDGTYTQAPPNGDNCLFQRTNINEDACTSWGNPMSEIYFESLRYFAGKSPTTTFTYTNKGSKDNQLGLPLPDWQDPLKIENYCAPLNVLVFNASVSTNDDDFRENGNTGDINATLNPALLTNQVGMTEGINGGNYFVGKLLGTTPTAASDANFELCTPKNIPGLGDVSGICPEGPTLGGSYLLAGLAHHARTNRVRTSITGIPGSDTRSLKVTTYGIQLATNTPQLAIAVPGSTTGQKVLIQPIYRLVQIAGTVKPCPAGLPDCLGGGALVDLKFISQSTVGNISTGKVYLNWEDSEQGGDFDQDMWGTLEWKLDATAGTISITTTTIAESTNNRQGFGYTISGTTQDGPHFHSGIEGFTYIDPTGALACNNCQVLGAAGGQRGPQSHTYTIGTSVGKTLQDPMWYAAKYGGFVDGNADGVPNVQGEWDSKLANGRPGSDGVPDTYFLVSNPLGLVAALDRAFVAILSNASASSVATNSTSLQTGTTIYQARFNANDWSGQVLAFTVDEKGQIATKATWDAGEILNSQHPLNNTVPPGDTTVSLNPDVISGSGRTIITVDDNRVGVKFRWPNDPNNPVTGEIGPSLVRALSVETEGDPPAIGTHDRARMRLEWLRGSQANEGATATGFRVRPISRLGDIINSNPNFIAAPNAGFGDAEYATFRKDNLEREAMIYVGGNDGMLHAFRAADGREVLAYIPSMVHQKLGKLTDKKYVGNQHRYSVDGSPEIADAYVKVGTDPKGWRTVLVSSLGGGGQGLFALDVTKPRQFSEATASKIAMWEFTDKDDPDLGYIYAQPTIRRMANGRFAAIVPGGYNQSKAEKGIRPEYDEAACTDSSAKLPAGCSTNTTGSAYLFIIFLDGPDHDGVAGWNEGTDYIKIRATAADDDPLTPNGLTQPLAADIDADGFVDFIYAGDLRGNLWKFDVRLAAHSLSGPPASPPFVAPFPSNASIAAWKAAENRLVLFTAKSKAEKPELEVTQPITGKPEATLHPTLSGFIITFGTGKYIERNDPYPPSGPPPNTVKDYQVQSFYGIWDKNDKRPINPNEDDQQTTVTSRDQLLEHVIAESSGSAEIRVVVPLDGKPDKPDWSKAKPPKATDSPSEGKHMGWVLELPGTGERSVFRPILTAGRLIFTTLLPLTQTCQFGGTSFTMVIDPTTGGRIDAAVLDTDANSQLNKDDVVGYGDAKIYASGLQSKIGITPTPTIIRSSGLPPGSTSEAGKAGSEILGTSGPLVAASGVLLAYALAAGSSGGNASTVIGLSAAGGRVSWRELTSD